MRQMLDRNRWQGQSGQRLRAAGLLGHQPVDKPLHQLPSAFALGLHHVIAETRDHRVVDRSAQPVLLQQVIHQMAPADGHALAGNRSLINRV